MTSYAQTTQLADHLGAKLIGINNTNVYDKLNGLATSLAEFSGSTVAAFNSAMFQLSVAGGGVLYIPFGSYTLTSAELSTAIAVPSNVTIEGNGSTLTVTGTTIIDSIFRSVNASNVTIRNMIAIGNSQAAANSSSGAFFNFVQDTNGAGLVNVRVENVQMQNFAAERWLHILNSHASLAIRGVRIINVSAISQTGNNIGGSSIGIGSNAIMVLGNTAPIKDVEITGFYCEADYIKCGICIFHKVQGITINKPIISNTGLVGTLDDKGAYAINCYGNPGELTDVTINDAYITSPRSCGIYLRGVYRATINKPDISGQTDVNNGTLPKGAISLDGSSYVTVQGGLLSGNVFDVNGAADTTATTFNLILNNVTMLGASQYAVILNPTTGAGSPDTFTMNGCLVDSNAQAVTIFNNIAAGARNVKNVLITECRITARAGTGLSFNPNGGGVCANYRVYNTLISATNRGIDADNATGDLHIDNVIIEDAGTIQLVYGLIARAFPLLHIGNLLVRGMGNGYATLTDGAGGSIANLRIFNVTNGCSPNSLGMIAPTLGGTLGWFVQNLAPVEAGVAASKYVNTGWRYTTAWLQQRTLTGN